MNFRDARNSSQMATVRAELWSAAPGGPPLTETFAGASATVGEVSFTRHGFWGVHGYAAVETGAGALTAEEGGLTWSGRFRAAHAWAGGEPAGTNPAGAGSATWRGIAEAVRTRDFACLPGTAAPAFRSGGAICSPPADASLGALPRATASRGASTAPVTRRPGAPSTPGRTSARSARSAGSRRGLSHCTAACRLHCRPGARREGARIPLSRVVKDGGGFPAAVESPDPVDIIEKHSFPPGLVQNPPSATSNQNANEGNQTPAHPGACLPDHCAITLFGPARTVYSRQYTGTPQR